MDRSLCEESKRGRMWLHARPEAVEKDRAKLIELEAALVRLEAAIERLGSAP